MLPGIRTPLLYKGYLTLFLAHTLGVCLSLTRSTLKGKKIKGGLSHANFQPSTKLLPVESAWRSPATTRQGAPLYAL